MAGTRKYVSVSAAGDSTCAVTPTGQGYCWGGNADGQLGTGDTEPHTTPVAVDQSGVRIGQVVRQLYGARQSMIVSLTAGTDRSCAVSPEQTVYCTGSGLLTEVPLAPSSPRAVKVAPATRAQGELGTARARRGRAGRRVRGHRRLARSAAERRLHRARAVVHHRRPDERPAILGVRGRDQHRRDRVQLDHPRRPEGGGGGGGLPITGPRGPLAAAIALLCAGLGLLLVARGRAATR